MENKKTNRADNISIDNRITDIAKMLIKGKTREDICQIISKRYNLSERQVDRYIKQAKEKIENRQQGSLKYEFNKHMARLETEYIDLREIAINSQNSKDHERVLIALRDIADITGIKKIDINLNTNGALMEIGNILENITDGI